MYVADPSPEDTDTMKITIINATGASWLVDVLPEYSIDKLKYMALSHFYHPVDSLKVSDRWKLVSVAQNRPLSDEGTLRDEEIQDNDELLLLRRRSPKIQKEESQEEKEKKLRGPTEIEIMKETASIPARNVERSIENPTVPVDFHTELRKILVSLVKVSEKLLRYHPEVMTLFKDMAEADQPIDERHNIDRTALKQLTDMGFSENQSIEALKQNTNVSDAMDWLLAQCAPDSSAPAAEAPTPPPPKPSSSPSLARKFSRLTVGKLVEKAHSSSQKEHPPPEAPSMSHASTSAPITSKPDPDTERLRDMIQTFRAYKRKVFRPNAAALSNLKEMGFPESDVLDALRINGNNQDTACDWLLSDKKPSLDNLEEGLDPEGPIYKSIMTNPVVQLGLCNPKTFLALLHMLENPTSACRWLSDPDTAPILSQIFRIYHAEKHSLQLARPFPQTM